MSSDRSSLTFAIASNEFSSALDAMHIICDEFAFSGWLLKCVQVVESFVMRTKCKSSALSAKELVLKYREFDNTVAMFNVTLSVIMAEARQLTLYWQKRAASYVLNKIPSYARLRQYLTVGGNRKLTTNNFKRFDKVETNLRTDKSIKGLWSFSTEIFVQCPHCAKRAVVWTALAKYNIPYPSRTNSKFRCNNCYKSINESQWYGPIYISPKYQRCDYCGTTLQYAEKVNKPKDKVELKCSTCKQEKSYDVSHSLTYANKIQATDPYFGLQLWLQIPVDDNILWAYNYDHLNYLKAYVAAKLREERVVTKYSMTQNLPNFIKLARNRGRVLKAIERLEKL